MIEINAHLHQTPPLNRVEDDPVARHARLEQFDLEDQEAHPFVQAGRRSHDRTSTHRGLLMESRHC